MAKGPVVPDCVSFFPESFVQYTPDAPVMVQVFPSDDSVVVTRMALTAAPLQDFPAFDRGISALVEVMKRRRLGLN